MSDHAPRYQWKSDYPIFIRRGLMSAIPVFLLWFLLAGDKISPVYVCKEWSLILFVGALYLFSLLSTWLCWSWGGSLCIGWTKNSSMAYSKCEGLSQN